MCHNCCDDPDPKIVGVHKTIHVVGAIRRVVIYFFVKQTLILDVLDNNGRARTGGVKLHYSTSGEGGGAVIGPLENARGTQL